MRTLEGLQEVYSSGIDWKKDGLLPGYCSACLGLDPGVSGGSVPASPSFLDRPFGCAISTSVSHPSQQAKCNDIPRFLWLHARIVMVRSALHC